MGKGIGFAIGASTRDKLTSDELQKSSNTPCKLPLLKRAFLFSALTGIPWSDINKMKWSEVREEGIDENGLPILRIVFKQEKTDGVEYLYISQQARQFFGKRMKEKERVFKGLRYNAHMKLQLLRWCIDAAISKHINLHSSRHTNAVLLLENGADILPCLSV